MTVVAGVVVEEQHYSEASVFVQIGAGLTCCLYCYCYEEGKSQKIVSLMDVIEERFDCCRFHRLNS